MKTSGLLLGIILLHNIHIDFVRTASIENESNIDEKTNITTEISEKTDSDNAEKSETTKTKLEESSGTLSKIGNVDESSLKIEDAAADESSDKTDKSNEHALNKNIDEVNIDETKEITEKLEKFGGDSKKDDLKNAKYSPEVDVKYEDNSANHFQKHEHLAVTSNAHIDKISNIDTTNSRKYDRVDQDNDKKGVDMVSDENKAGKNNENDKKLSSNSDQIDSEYDSRHVNRDTNESISVKVNANNLGESSNRRVGNNDIESAKPKILPEVIGSVSDLGVDLNKDYSLEEIMDFSKRIKNEEGVSEDLYSQTSDDYSAPFEPDNAQIKTYLPPVIEHLGTSEIESDALEREGFDNKDFEADAKQITAHTDEHANIEIKSRKNADDDEDEIVGAVKPVSNNDVRTFHALTNQLDSRRYANQGIVPHLQPAIEKNGLMLPPVHNYAYQRSSENHIHPQHSVSQQYNHQLNPLQERILTPFNKHINEFNNEETLLANAYPFEPKYKKNINEHNELADVPEDPVTRNGYEGQNIQPTFHSIQNMQTPGENIKIPLFNKPIPVQNFPMPTLKIPAQNLKAPQQSMQMPAYNMQATYQNTRTPAYNMQTPHLSMRTPAYNMQAPHPSMRTPAYNMQAPHLSMRTPAYNMQAPHQNIRTPAYNIQAPHQSIQIPSYNMQAQHRIMQMPAYNVQVSANNLHSYGHGMQSMQASMYKSNSFDRTNTNAQLLSRNLENHSVQSTGYYPRTFTSPSFSHSGEAYSTQAVYRTRNMEHYDQNRYTDAPKSAIRYTSFSF